MVQRSTAPVGWDDEMGSADYSEREIHVQYSVWASLGQMEGATSFPPAREVTVERELTVHDSELDAAFNGTVVPTVLEEIGVPEPIRAANQFVSQVRKLAKADGLRLSDEEARALANLMFLVGRKLADELE